MTIEIDYLTYHQEKIEQISDIWRAELGSVWCPQVGIKQVTAKLTEHLNLDSLPLCKIALSDNKPVGMCCLRKNDGIRQELSPWLGGLVVSKPYQSQGIAKILVDTIKTTAYSMGYQTLYLFCFAEQLVHFYQHLGWKFIDTDVFMCKTVYVMEYTLG